MIGTGPVALAGVDIVAWIVTDTCGYAELSTTPRKTFVRTFPFTVLLATSHFTCGTSLGILPYISRSKSSTISGRRFSYHVFSSVTFVPSLHVIMSGSVVEACAGRPFPITSV
jgi:hypothetical protein